MYKKLMVPLDGSPLAEKALPYAVALANRINAELLLLRVSELPALVNDTPEHELEVINIAEQYLAEVEQILTDPANESHLDPERVQSLVAYGESVREISEIAPFEKVDLIIMTTHGRTGIPRLVLGSVATSIIQRSTLPVMLLRPEKLDDDIPLEELLAKPTCFSQDDLSTRIVVTLDGTREAESVIPPAIELAKKLGAAVYLLRVIAPFIPVEYGDLGGGYAFDIDQETANRREVAYQYLDQVQTQFTEHGLNCVKVVRLGNPAPEIIDYVEKVHAATLVMATHARNKLGHMFMGSVADEVTRRTNLPVMMVHTTVPEKVVEQAEEKVVSVS